MPHAFQTVWGALLFLSHKNYLNDGSQFPALVFLTCHTVGNCLTLLFQVLCLVREADSFLVSRPSMIEVEILSAFRRVRWIPNQSNQKRTYITFLYGLFGAVPPNAAWLAYR